MMTIMLMTTKSNNEYDGAACVDDVTDEDEWRG